MCTKLTTAIITINWKLLTSNFRLDYIRCYLLQNIFGVNINPYYPTILCFSHTVCENIEFYQKHIKRKISKKWHSEPKFNKLNFTSHPALTSLCNFKINNIKFKSRRQFNLLSKCLGKCHKPLHHYTEVSGSIFRKSVYSFMELRAEIAAFLKGQNV